MKITANRFSTRIAGCLVAAITLTGLTLASPAIATAQPGQNANQNPGVHPPQSKPYGLSYGDWSALWWQWLLKAPAATNPNLATDGSYCGDGQSGPVWFLPGGFNNQPAQATRNCTVPTGKSFLLPLPNAIFGAGVLDCETPGYAPDPCSSYQFGSLTGVPALHAAAAAYIDTIDIQAVSVTLDSVPLRNLGAYRFSSGAFSYMLPADNVIQSIGVPDPPGIYGPAVADGYWLMLTPLSPGTHWIVSGGLTYRLLVVP